MVLLISLKKKLLHLFELIESAVTKTSWAISFIAINACVTVLVSIYHDLTFEAFYLGNFSNMGNHALELVVVALSVFFNALNFCAHS
jgi:hypothetical protein